MLQDTRHMTTMKDQYNHLAGLKVYLSGPIQYANDHGVAWRDKIKEMLRPMNLEIIDPCDKGNFLSEIGNFREQMQQWREEGNYNEIVKHMKMVRRYDLRSVDYSNFIIANIDKNIPSWGTVDECIVAERQKKPIIIISQDGHQGCPDWLFAIAEMHEIFSSIEEAIEYLEQINKNGFGDDMRWMKI